MGADRKESVVLTNMCMIQDGSKVLVEESFLENSFIVFLRFSRNVHLEYRKNKIYLNYENSNTALEVWLRQSEDQEEKNELF